MDNLEKKIKEAFSKEEEFNNMINTLAYLGSKSMMTSSISLSDFAGLMADAIEKYGRDKVISAIEEKMASNNNKE